MLPPMLRYTASLAALSIAAVGALARAASPYPADAPLNEKADPGRWARPIEIASLPPGAPNEIETGLGIVRDAIAYFVRGFVPDPTGAEKPNAFEWYVDQFGVRIKNPNGKNSRFQFAAGGSANNKDLGNSILFNQVQLTAGALIDVLDADNPNDTIQLRVFPAFLEMAWLRPATGSTSPYEPSAQLPGRTLLGAGGGVEAAKTWGPVRAGARLDARPLIEVGDKDTVGPTRDTGVEMHGMIYTRIALDQILKDTLPRGVQLTLVPSIHYMRRSDALADLFRWNGSPGQPVQLGRRVGEISNVVQTMWYLDLVLTDPLIK